MRPALIVLAAALALPAAAGAAEPQWRVHAEASGSYRLDYGAERDAIDGSADGVWAWEMKALAAGTELDTGTAIFRMDVEESSSIVLTDGSPACRPPQSGSVGWLRDSRVGLYLARSPRGFRVDHPFVDLLAGCHAGAHGMSLYDGAAPAETRVGRREFRPRVDRFFERTWTQQIVLDQTHERGTPHTFSAMGGLTISVRRISARAARLLRLRLRLRSTPRTPRA
jgi:hypothetical protein